MKYLVDGTVSKIRNLNAVARNAAITGTVLLAGAAPAFAVGVEDTAVTGAFSALADDLKATLVPIAVVAIGIFVVFLGFRYGKRLFKTVAS